MHAGAWAQAVGSGWVEAATYVSLTCHYARGKDMPRQEATARRERPKYNGEMSKKMHCPHACTNAHFN